MFRLRAVFVLVLLLAVVMPMRVIAAGGNILYLITWGGGTPDTLVYIQTTVQATERTNNSNLYYVITGPGSDPTIRATQKTLLSKLEAWEAYTDEWSVSNSGWPEGTYTVSLCWSTGNATNCNIDGPVTTTFYSVPALDWVFASIGLAALFFWLWRRRKEFRPVPAGEGG